MSSSNQYKGQLFPLHFVLIYIELKYFYCAEEFIKPSYHLSIAHSDYTNTRVLSVQ